MAEQPKVTPRGDVILRLRAEQGFRTQEAFAAAVGLDVRVIRVAEQGRPSTVNTVTMIHQLLVKKKPDLRYQDLITFETGFHIDKNVQAVSDEKDIQPLIQWLLAQPTVEYAILIKVRPAGSTLLDIAMTYMSVRSVVLPAFARRQLDGFGITAIYLYPAFLECVQWELAVSLDDVEDLAFPKPTLQGWLHEVTGYADHDLQISLGEDGVAVVSREIHVRDNVHV